jgi:DNA polymerase-1
VQAGLRMRRLSSLRSKYIDKYWKAQIEGVLHYSLYQLRAGEEDFGTVVGRYSSANVNCQQIMKPSNQWSKFCDCGCQRSLQEDIRNHKPGCLGTHYTIRELIIPDDGYDMCAVDGSQLQFRLFAHYSNDLDLIMAYQRDLHLKPGEKAVDFHQLVATMFNLERQAAKHSSFAMILGMGRQKLADRCGLSCTCQSPAYWARQTSGVKRDKSHIFGVNSNHSSNCPARKSNDQGDQYAEKFPAAKALMDQISGLAESRGYIKTLLGRRRRYKEGDKFYSAFAGLLQGSESDVVKSKIITLYNERKTIGIHKLRAPIHDEVVLDIDKTEQARLRFAEVCKIQEVPLKVPLVWSAGFGDNWAQCH